MSSTNVVQTWNVSPSFTATKDAVYIGVGNWIGVLPANPSAGPARIPILRALPRGDLEARVNTVLADLTRLQRQAAAGLATYWNCEIMQKNSLGACPQPGKFTVPWVMQPIIRNHGDQPYAIDWAVDLPQSLEHTQAVKLVHDDVSP